ncbi:MAG: hypothetical protein DDT19_03006 [Syntrophomonadaceae bacterium]|nr:hypothetical protein [Bacillota bacterium]
MVSSGIPAHKAMLSIAERIEDGKMIEKLTIAAEMMEKEGSTFADATVAVGLFEKYSALLQIGQKTGNLKEIMREIMLLSAQITAVSKKAKSSLYYPVGIVLISFVVGYLLTFTLESMVMALRFPGIEEQFSFLYAVFFVSNRNIIFAVYGLALVLLGFVFYHKASSLPVISGLLSSIVTGQAFKSFAIAMKSGMSPSQGFTFAAEGIGDKHKQWRQTFDDMAVESATSSVVDTIGNLDGLLEADNYLVLRSRCESGDIAGAFEQVGSQKMQDSIQKLDALAPFVSVFAVIFVTFQIVVIILAPIYSLIFSMMGMDMLGR